jgi:hypothetical protein
VTGAARILQVGAEIFPLVKTGGLGDVLGALPQALVRQGFDVRLLLPGYPALRQPLADAQRVCTLGPAFGAASIEILLGRLPGIDLPAYVIDAPSLYERPGNPYVDAEGKEWTDNALRFGLLGWVAAHLGLGDIDRSWRPQIVHGHDWHAGLAATYLALHPQPAAAASSPSTTSPLPVSSSASCCRRCCCPKTASAWRRGVSRRGLDAQGRPAVRRCDHHRQSDLRTARSARPSSAAAWKA